jgi:hypothetical protein
MCTYQIEDGRNAQTKAAAKLAQFQPLGCDFYVTFGIFPFNLWVWQDESYILRILAQISRSASPTRSIRAGPIDAAGNLQDSQHGHADS